MEKKVINISPKRHEIPRGNGVTLQCYQDNYIYDSQ